MSDTVEPPRNYYDFDWLLKPAPKLQPEEQKELMVELMQMEQNGRDIVIDCAVNAFVIEGDNRYAEDVSYKAYVGTEASIAGAKKEFREMKNTLDLVGVVKKKMLTFPGCAPHYTRLFDFEMWLLRQEKKKRLTSK